MGYNNVTYVRYSTNMATKDASVGALDVAAYILDKFGELDAMRLQKLTYYSQAWYLAWKGEPLFNDPIEAWANGPVVRRLYREHRGQFVLQAGVIPGVPDKLSSDQKRVIDSVCSSYGNLTGWQLSQLSHEEFPWVEARRRAKVQDGDPSTERIDPEDILTFFQSKAAKD